MGADVLPGLIISGITRGRVNPTLPYLVTKTGAESYSEARLEGLDHETALQYGSIDAALELLTEKIPTKIAEDMFSKLGTGDLRASISKFMIGDMTGEQIATATQTLNAVAFDLDKELINAESVQEIFDIQVERQVVTAISTLIGSGGISGTAYTANRIAGAGRVKDKALLKNIENKMQSEAADKWLEDQIFLAQGSKTNERDAASFATYLEQLDSETRVFMDAEVAGQLDVVPDYIQEQLDGTGADVSIPLAKFLTDFATNEQRLEQVRPHVKVQSEFMTQTEAQGEGDSAQVKTLLEKANKETEAKIEADMIFEQVKDQLIGTGRQGQQTSRMSAELIPAYIVTKQKELQSRGIDVSVKALYEDMGLSVVGPKDAPVVGEGQVLEQEDKQADFFRKTTEQYVRESGFENAITDRGTIKVFHGTSRANANAIKDSKNFKGFPFFALDQETAKRFAQQAGGTIEIMEVEVDSSALVPTGGYLTARMEGLTVDKSGVFRSSAQPSEQQPKVLSQQDFGTIEITRTRTNVAGNIVNITEKAQPLWDEQQKRMTALESLRGCLNA